MFELASTNIEVRAESSETMQHLDWFFGAALRTPASRDLESLRIQFSRATTARPPAACDSSVGPVDRWNEPSCVRFWHESGRGASVTKDEITIDAPLSVGADSWRSARQLLAEALAVWFGARGAVVMHAAHVGIDDVGLMALGPTGSGKSTVAAAALAAGWDVHGDDLAIVQRRGTAADVHGIPKRPSFDPLVMTRTDFPLEPDGRDARGRLTTSADLMTAGWTELRAIVDLEHDNGHGTVKRIRHADTLHALIASTFGVHDGRHLAHCLPALASMADLPAYRIGLASSPDCRLGHVRDVLAWIWTDLAQRDQDSFEAG